MDADIEIVEDAERLRPKDSEVMRLCCDATRLRERTGWAPAHTRDAGLQQTIAWFRDPANLARYRPATTPADHPPPTRFLPDEGQRHARRDPRRRQGRSPAPVHHPAAQAARADRGRVLDPRDRAAPARPAGLHRATLAIGHLGNLIRAYVGDGWRWGIEVDYATEDTPLGTIGPLLQILDRLPEDFLVMNGDVLTDLDYAALLRDHSASGAPLTVATYARRCGSTSGCSRRRRAGWSGSPRSRRSTTG